MDQEGAHTHGSEEHWHHFEEDSNYYYQGLVVTSCESNPNPDTRMVSDVNDDGYTYHCVNYADATTPKRTIITSATATVYPASSGLGGIDGGQDGARSAAETRPKNMKAVFIMRIQ